MVEAIDLGLLVPQAAEEGELELLQGFLHLGRAVFPDQQALAFMKMKVMMVMMVMVVPHVPLFIIRGRPVVFETACRRLAHLLIAEQLRNALENLFHLAVRDVLAPPCGHGMKLQLLLERHDTNAAPPFVPPPFCFFLPPFLAFVDTTDP